MPNLIINKDKMSDEFMKAFTVLRAQHMDEILWHGSVDADGGFKLMDKHTRENIELGKKFGVID